MKGLGALLFGQLFVAAGNLLLVPLYLVRWSATVYGEWLAMFSLASYLSTLDLGMNMAVVNRLTQAYVRRDMEEYAECQHSALAFYLLMASTATVLLAIAAACFPLSGWLGLKETPGSDAFWVVVVLGMQVVFAMPLGMVTNVYRTMGDLAASQWIGNAQRLFALLLIAAGLACGGRLKTIALLQLIPLLLGPALVYLDLRRRFPSLAPGLSHARLPVVSGLLRPSLLFFLIMLAGALTQQGSVMLVSSVMGGVVVALFVTTRTLTNLIRQVVGVFNSAIWPDLTAIEVREEHQRLRNLHRLLVIGSSTVCVAVAAARWFEGAEIITVWTRGRLQPDVVLLRLLLVQLVLSSPWLASSVFTAATNRHASLSRSYLVAAVVGVGLAAALIRRLGLAAVPIGLIAGEAIACYHFVLKDSCEIVGECYAGFARRLWLRLPVVVAAGMLAGSAAHHAVPGPSPLRWLAVGSTTVVAASLSSWWLWLDRNTRAAVVQRLRISTGADLVRTALLGR